MTARYAHLDGRYWVNADFIARVRQAYPATTKKIPLGFSTYTGWSGKDEVLFTQHDPIEELGDFGPTFEVTFEPSNPAAFEEDILGVVKHTKVSPTKKTSSRQRTRPSSELDNLWGPTLEDTRKAKKASEEKARKRAQWRKFVGAVREEMSRETEVRRESSTDDDWLSWD